MVTKIIWGSCQNEGFDSESLGDPKILHFKQAPGNVTPPATWITLWVARTLMILGPTVSADVSFTISKHVFTNQSH